MKKISLILFIFLKVSLYSNSIKLKAPINNASFSNQDINLINFAWEGISVSSSFQIEISTDSIFSFPVIYSSSSISQEIDLNNFTL